MTNARNDQSPISVVNGLKESRIIDPDALNRLSIPSRSSISMKGLHLEPRVQKCGFHKVKGTETAMQHA